MDIVSLLRFELKISEELSPYSNVIDYNFMRWTMAKNAGNVHFTEEQMEWLHEKVYVYCLLQKFWLPINGHLWFALSHSSYLVCS